MSSKKTTTTTTTKQEDALTADAFLRIKQGKALYAQTRHREMYAAAAIETAASTLAVRMRTVLMNRLRDLVTNTNVAIRFDTTIYPLFKLQRTVYYCKD